MRGTIALDIDGTLTDESYTVSPKVTAYLANLVKEGWQIIFITGRTFHFGFDILKDLPFHHYLAVQNGAIILEMPKAAIVSKKYLDLSIINPLEEICSERSTDFVIYAGFEYEDACYYRPKYFSRPLLHYLNRRIEAFKERWTAVDSYQDINLKEFPSIKCFGHYQEALELSQEIEKRLGLHIPLIRDPFDESYYVVQGTHPKISKGQALKDMMSLTKQTGKVIAAGDDYNDIDRKSVV